VPEPAVGRPGADFAPLRKDVKPRKKSGLINSVDDEMWLNSMPQTHQAESKEITEDSCNVPINDPSTALGCRQQKTHVNVVPEPKGKRDMPTVPEISNIAC
jgi:hypothetical protein